MRQPGQGPFGPRLLLSLRKASVSRELKPGQEMLSSELTLRQGGPRWMWTFPAQHSIKRPGEAGTFDWALTAPEEKPAMPGYF